jgi:high-affinity iron transporter
MATWFAAVRIIDDLTESISALHIQAATGLLAIAVLIVVMNWFFHKVYWTAWISMHNRRKETLLQREPKGHDGVMTARLLWGLGLLGFTSLYREGFEIVLFLQSYRLKLGSSAVFRGASVGILLASSVALLTFVAHQRLPYRRMLVLTGVMLACVLLVMTGEEVQEMQLAHWLRTTEIPMLATTMPDWIGMWFAIFPNVEGLTGQIVAATLVFGSYFVSERRVRTRYTSGLH